MIRPPPTSPLFPYTTLFRSGVEQRLHALVLEGRAAEHRRHGDVERGLADRRLETRDVDDLLGEVGLHQLVVVVGDRLDQVGADRKSTRLNSSHMSISYAVFC